MGYSCHGAVSWSHLKPWSDRSKSKQCGFPTFDYCTCLLILTLNLKPQTIRTFTPVKTKIVQGEHLILWTSPSRGEKKAKITPRQSGGIYDFLDDTFIKGGLPFILMREKKLLFKVSIP